MTISPQAVERLKGNNRGMARLMEFFDRSSQTIELWLKDPVDVRLTTPDVVRLIAESTGLTEDEVLVDGKAAVWQK